MKYVNCYCGNNDMGTWDACTEGQREQCQREGEDHLTAQGWIKLASGTFVHPNQPDYPEAFKL